MPLFDLFSVTRACIWIHNRLPQASKTLKIPRSTVFSEFSDSENAGAKLDNNEVNKDLDAFPFMPIVSTGLHGINGAFLIIYISFFILNFMSSNG